MIDIAQLVLDHIYKLYGMSKTIVSARDAVFLRKVWQQLFLAHGVTLSTLSAYHPQSNGQTKVLNRCLENFLRCYCLDAPADWCNYLPLAEW